MLASANTGYWSQTERLNMLAQIPGISVVHAYAELDSTNTLATTLGLAGAASGTLVLAERQTAGRGRLDRAWYSPSGQLYFSVVWRFPWPALRAPQITLEVATAIARAFTERWDLTPTVKWPNDVLFGGQKCCGVLTELRTIGADIDFVVVGVGINLQPVGGDAPSELRNSAISLSEVTGESIAPMDALCAVLTAMHNGREYLLREGAFDRSGWMAFSNKGAVVRVCPPGREAFIGQVAGVSENGCLLVEKSSGQTVTVIAGDVVEQREVR